jgi:hypothetical protein
MMTSGEAQKRIRVIFLTFYFEAWDALADIHDQMLVDDRFDVKVISIPRRFSSESEFAEEDQVDEFFDNIGVSHLRFNERDSFANLAKLRDLAPDYVFINYPWQRNYPPGYRVEQLSEFTKVCYVPYYSMQLVNELGEEGVAPHLYQQRSHQLASLIFTQDSNVREAYAHTERGNDHVYLTGTPKLDAQFRQVQSGDKRWPIADIGNYRVLWAPHHSYSHTWLNFGVFSQIYLQMLNFAKTHPQVDLVMRPHPLMFDTLVDREVINQGGLAAWLDAWNSLPNTDIDSDGNVAQLFAATDLLVTDGISFLGEYPLATGKPAIFIENPNHWPWSPMGELVAAANIKVHTFEEFTDAFNNIRKNGLPDYSRQIAALKTAANPHPGEAAAKIVQIVVADFEAKTPLVDKSKVTEVAWENRPGTEPAWD